MTQSTSPLATVLAYHDAWTSGDVATAMTHVAEDVVALAPGVQLPGRDAWQAYLDGFAPALLGVEDLAHLADDTRVSLWYVTRTAAAAAPVAELFTVDDGRITRISTIFDRLSFGPPEE